GQARRPSDARRAGWGGAQEAEPRAKGAFRLAPPPARDAQAGSPVLRVRAVVDARRRGRPAPPCCPRRGGGDRTPLPARLRTGRPRLRSEERRVGKESGAELARGSCR